MVPLPVGFKAGPGLAIILLGGQCGKKTLLEESCYHTVKAGVEIVYIEGSIVHKK